ncbi:tyrosine-type recombinase/integrase [Algoriphagus algorifonticola]|uniref:tyrosine-type recombinase/integrase n=1 Tax=Algoriphagus algorifonticola TaxID=2593007 RepID=UPI0011A2541F|nr:site-specific integrase [Algoriphagus algorifonticola]
MYRTKYVLKNPSKKSGIGKITIEIYFSRDGRRERMYLPTGEEIHEKYWTNGAISKSYSQKEQLLRRLEDKHHEVKQQLYQWEKELGYLNADLVKAKLEEKPVQEKDMLTLFDEFMEVKRLTAKHKMVIKLNTIRNHLGEFLGKKRMYLVEYNQTFINRLTHYWEQKVGLQPNTIHKNFRFILLFLNYLKKEGVLENEFYKEFQYPRTVETNTIVLTKDEVVKLIQYVPKTNSESKVRDLFLVLIFTGLRFGDAVRISKSWVRGEFLYINTQKTGERVSIPLHPRLKAVLDKYEYDLKPLKISNQKFNDYVKDLCKEAGITDPIEIVRHEKGVRQYLTFPKHKLIASHTGRRTFITNAILAGIPLPVIQKITGHRKLTTLQKYVEIADDSKKSELEKLTNYFK